MKTSITIFLVLLLASCSKSTESLLSVDDLNITWSVVENMEGSYANSWKISNQGPGILPADGWAIYYNHVVGVPVEGSVSGSLNVSQISGTFYRITPNEAFKPLGNGESTRLDLKCSGYGLKITDAPTGLYLVLDGQDPQIIENFQIGPFPPAHLMKRGRTDNVPVPTAEWRYQQNEFLSFISQDDQPAIIPTPKDVKPGQGVFMLPDQLLIGCQTGLEDEARLLLQKLETTGRSVELADDLGSANIILQLGSFGQNKAENYRLTVEKDQVVITGSDAAGVFYGAQSLVSIWPLEAWEDNDEGLEISCQTVTDGPRFSYRGLYLDVARNFQKPETVKRLLDMMAFYKLNRLTLGVSNDEGWRLEIKGIPELTGFGARRGHTLDEEDHLMPAYGSGPFTEGENNHGSGYFSRETFIDILKYAQQRHIEVIPEINFPGHARAAIKSMEARTRRIEESGSNEQKFTLHDPGDQSEYQSVQGYTDNVICPCQETVFQFLEWVSADLVSMYQEAGVKFTTVHTGGDEVPTGIWEKSPMCADFLEQNPQVEGVAGLPGYFLQRYHQILQQNQLVTGGWEEIAMHRPPPDQLEDSGPAPHGLVPNPEFTNANFLPYVWNSDWGSSDDLAYKLANLGYEIILCNANNLYFDFAYNKDPMEPGFYWSGLVNTWQSYAWVPFDILQTGTFDKLGNTLKVEDFEDKVKLQSQSRKNIIGIQGQLWSETVKGPELLEYYLFPKMLGMVERAWAPDPEWSSLPKKSERLQGLDLAWNKFANALAQRELPRLDYLWGGVNYRVPLPGAITRDGNLMANVAFPGLTIRYTLDGSEPTKNSPLYQGPVAGKKPVRLKAYSRTGKPSRTSILDF